MCCGGYGDGGVVAYFSDVDVMVLVTAMFFCSSDLFDVAAAVIIYLNLISKIMLLLSFCFKCSDQKSKPFIASIYTAFLVQRERERERERGGEGVRERESRCACVGVCVFVRVTYTLMLDLHPCLQAKQNEHNAIHNSYVLQLNTLYLKCYEN